MSIGTAERPINIKDLILDTPERQRELPFDPEKEITESDWRRLMVERQKLRKENWDAFFRLTMEMKLLFPSRTAELEIERDLPILKEGVKEGEYSERNLPGYLVNIYDRAIFLKFLSPEDNRKYYERLWDRLQGDYARGFTTMNTAGIISGIGRQIACLFPERLSQLRRDEKTWDLLQKECEHLSSSGRIENPHFFISVLTGMRFLFPQRKEEVLSLFRDSGRQALQQLLNRCRESRSFFYNLASITLDGKLLVAEEVRVTDKGIEIIMPKLKQPFDQPSPPMPEVRRF